MTGRHALIAALALVSLVSCTPDDQPTEEFDVTGGAQSRENMPVEAVAQLDSGSQAFRDEDYEAALAHYTRFTEIAPDFGAGWFGIYMSQRELGNEAEAEAALEQARAAVPGASLIHEQSPDSVP